VIRELRFVIGEFRIVGHGLDLILNLKFEIQEHQNILWNY